MIIRRATADDESVMRDLWARLSAETSYDDPLAGTEFTTDLITERIALLAEDGELVIGAVYANIVSEQVGFVFGLYVRPSSRRRGVGRELTLAIAEAIRAEGRTHILLNVESPNAEARHFYERLGFLDHARMMRIEVESLLT
jgi:ribosomal protein S18 acetylase RimI-like enzyme